MTRTRAVRRAAAGVALAAALIVSASCGVRTDPRPPENTQPRPPAGFVAKQVDHGIRLDWKRPTHSSDGMRLADLAGFLVERESPAIDAFEVIADIPVEDTHRIRPQQEFSFLDSRPPAGPLRYRVRAYAKDSQVGRASVIAAIEDETK